MPVAKGAVIDPAATRARILDAATRLFYTRGVHAVGVNEIAAAAGSSKLSLYRHFSSKQDLVRAMLTERSERIHTWLRAETGHAETGHAEAGTQRVLGVFDLLIDWFAEAGYRGCAVVNAVSDTRGDHLAASPDPMSEDRADAPVTDIAPLARAHLARYRELLTERLTELDPRPQDPVTLARQLLLLIEGATVVTAIDRPDVTAGHDARAAAEVLLGAATAEAEHPRFER